MKIPFMSRLINSNTNVKTLDKVIAEWLSFHRTEISESTYYSYKIICPSLSDYFMGIPICNVNTLAINLFIMAMKEKGMTNAAVYNYCRVLKLCFDYACANGYISSNPVSNACVPKLPKHAEVFPFTIEEVSMLLNLDYLQWVKDGVVIAFFTGMRMGEIYALKWTDINFENKFIMVQRSQSRACSNITIKTTKTACGIRRIDIGKYLINYLKSMEEHSDSEYVFSPADGYTKYPFRVPWNLSWHIKQMCVMAGIPPRSFHAFRHTHATILLSKGVHPKVVQERLGHSDVSITVMTYSHVSPTIQREAVNTMDEECKQWLDKANAKEFDSIGFI